MINIKGLFEYDKLLDKYETLDKKHEILCEDYKKRVSEIQKYYAEIAVNQKLEIDKLNKAYRKMTARNSELLEEIEKQKKKANDHVTRAADAERNLIEKEKTIEALQNKIDELESKQAIRWHWNADRGEWWPVEGSIQQIQSKVSVPLTYKTAEEVESE